MVYVTKNAKCKKININGMVSGSSGPNGSPNGPNMVSMVSSGSRSPNHHMFAQNVI